MRTVPICTAIVAMLAASSATAGKLEGLHAAVGKLQRGAETLGPDGLYADGRSSSLVR